PLVWLRAGNAELFPVSGGYRQTAHLSPGVAREGGEIACRNSDNTVAKIARCQEKHAKSALLGLPPGPLNIDQTFRTFGPVCPTVLIKFPKAALADCRNFTTIFQWQR